MADSSVAPHGLGERGGAFWAAAMGRYDFTASESELLVEVSRCLDEVEAR